MAIRRVSKFVAKLTGALAVVWLALRLVGTYWTARAVDDGLTAFSEPLRSAAQDALDTAIIGCRDNPIVRLIHPRKLRVEEVRPDPRCDRSPRRSGYVVTIRAYGPFATPRETITDWCGGGMDCGVFPIQRPAER